MWYSLLTSFCIFVSFCISIYILSVSYHSVIHMDLSTLEQFPWGLLYTVISYICISYSLTLVLIYRYRFENIHLLHTYYIIILYLQIKWLLCFSCIKLYMEWEQYTWVTGTILKTTPETHDGIIHHIISLSFIQQEQKVADRGFSYVVVQQWSAWLNYIHMDSNLQQFAKLSETYFLTIVCH